MKTTFTCNIRTQSGKDKHANQVFAAYKNGTVCITRAYTKRRLTENNHLVGSKLKAASGLYKLIRDDFKKDLQVYAHAFNHQLLAEDKLPLAPYHIFIKAVCKHTDPITSLDGINGLIMTLGSSISLWIDRGYLPNVSKAKFTNVSISA